MSYQETVNEIIDIPDPVLAAKKLQDLAQGYRSQENIGVLVVRLMLSTGEKTRMREMLQIQFEHEQRLLAELKLRDIEREEERKRAELEEMNESVPMDIVKLKGAKRRKQVGGVFDGAESGFHDEDAIDAMLVRPVPNNINGDPTTNWEILLQRRLTEEVKDKELIHAMRVQEHDPYFPSINSDENWSTTTKLKGQLKERTVTLPPQDDFIRKNPNPPSPPHLPRRQIIPEAATLSTESVEFRRELKHPLNVDRDAVLFHNMQLDRHKNLSQSSRSIDSIQSDPAYNSNKHIPMKERKSSSHSIEVLLHGPDAVHNRQASFGGSHKLPKEETKKEKGTDSCPTDMNDRLQQLEKNGFLPETGKVVNGKHGNPGRRIEMGEVRDEESVMQTNDDVDDDFDDIPGMVGDNDDFGEDIEDNDNDSIGGDSLGGDYETIGGVSNSRKKKNARAKSPEVEETEIMINGVDFSANEPSQPDEVERISFLDWKNMKRSSSDGEVSVKDKSELVDVSALYATVKKTRKMPVKENMTTNDLNETLGVKTVSKTSDTVRANGTELHHWNDMQNLTTPVRNTRDSSALPSTQTSFPPRPPPPALPKHSPTLNGHKHNMHIPVDNHRDSVVIEPMVHNHGAKTNSQHPPARQDNHQELKQSSTKSSNSSQDKHIETVTPHESHKKTHAPPIPPRMPIKSPSPTTVPHPPTLPHPPATHSPPKTQPQSDINSNSIKSLEDLIAYNRLQQQKVSYKATPKPAPPPPTPGEPLTTMVTKTASQRSIIITYL